MKRLVLLAWMLIGIIGSASAQRDDLYFVPKKKVKAEAQDPALQESPLEKDVNHDKPVSATPVEEGRGGATLVLEMDEDAYNRRGSYLTEQGDAVSEFAMNDEGFVLITEDGDTMWMNTDTLRLSRVTDGEGWVNGFDGSDSDYEYAMRIIRFRNPRYAIPVSSPLYWDVVYGGALWPSWDWNIYDDGMYAYVFPTTSNWYYWDYRMSYPFGWSAWGSPWSYHYGCHWGHHWGGYHYGHMWYDPWFNPYFHDYYPGWHHAHHHHGHYPHWGNHGWGGGAPKAYPNHRTPTYASSRRDSQGSSAPGRGDVRSSSSSRTGSTAGRVSTDGTRRIYNGSERNSSVRVVTGNSGSMRSSGSSRVGSDEALRRGTGSSSANRSTYTGNASRSSYTSQGTSRSSGSTSSYSRSSSTRVSSSSSMSRSSSSSSGSSRSSYSSGSSSYSSGSSRSSYSSGSSSYSSGSSSRSSYSGGGSYSSGGGSSRSSGSRR